jgi:hypothetical protein
VRDSLVLQPRKRKEGLAVFQARDKGKKKKKKSVLRRASSKL